MDLHAYSAAVAVHCPALLAGLMPLRWFCHLAQALSFLGACAAVVVPVASKTAMVKAWAHSAAELALSRLGIAAVGVAMTLKLLGRPVDGPVGFLEQVAARIHVASAESVA